MLLLKGTLLVLLVTLAKSARVTVDSQYGRVIGESFTLHNGKTVNRFHGIPYGKPAVGPLRFAVCISFFVYKE